MQPQATKLLVQFNGQVREVDIDRAANSDYVTASVTLPSINRQCCASSEVPYWGTPSTTGCVFLQ